MQKFKKGDIVTNEHYASRGITYVYLEYDVSKLSPHRVTYNDAEGKETGFSDNANLYLIAPAREENNAVSPNETRSTSSTGAEKGVKPQMYSLIPVEAMEQVAEHYGVGTAKYDDHNWRKGYEWSKSYNSLQRHANAFWRGEDNDPELGTPHMAAVVFHALTLLTFVQEQPGFDDRFKNLE
jgi:hypothetical protein